MRDHLFTEIDVGNSVEACLHINSSGVVLCLAWRHLIIRKEVGRSKKQPSFFFFLTLSVSLRVSNKDSVPVALHKWGYHFLFFLKRTQAVKRKRRKKRLITLCFRNILQCKLSSLSHIFVLAIKQKKLSNWNIVNINKKTTCFLTGYGHWQQKHCNIQHFSYLN